MKTLSNTTIDRLGNRLRKGNLTDDDLRLLDEYRRSFAGAYDEVIGVIRDRLELEPTGRPAKSTTSITQKLQRESIRLTQMQDVAGCRIVVADRSEQDGVVTALTGLFTNNQIVDRRQKPSHGYRAVHVIVVLDKRAVEIQARTVLQQRWAELCEKASDLIDPAIKYGGGGDDLQELFAGASNSIAKLEEREYLALRAQQKLAQLSEGPLTNNERADIISLQEKVVSIRAHLGTARETLLDTFREALENLQE
jgi:ppGpp synthetase/RelA/SpoT-type nucleotidyltranferase